MECLVSSTQHHCIFCIVIFSAYLSGRSSDEVFIRKKDKKNKSNTVFILGEHLSLCGHGFLSEHPVFLSKNGKGYTLNTLFISTNVGHCIHHFYDIHNNSQEGLGSQ